MPIMGVISADTRRLYYSSHDHLGFMVVYAGYIGLYRSFGNIEGFCMEGLGLD